MDPDQTLVREARAGSREAFDALVRRHERRVFNLARALTASDSEAEDLAQETFLRAYQGLRRFRGDSAFATWLHRIAINTINSHLARRCLRIEDPEPRQERDDGREAEPASGMSLEDDLARRDAIDRALATLPPELRATLVLRDVEGFGYAEIATMLGVPLGTVESRLFRARQRLRHVLASFMTGAGT